jgi:hypothetical protein
MWTQFWDMHSGGGCKESPYEYIYIEASQSEAMVIFYNRFGHNPERVTCTCCGEDYSISDSETLEQLTGFHRHCRYMQRGKPRNGDYDFRYIENDEEVPEGYKGGRQPIGTYMSMEEYMEEENVLIIRENDILPEERTGTVPEQGYVWRD